MKKIISISIMLRNCLVVMFFQLICSPSVLAFPPYKSTDADTAAPYNLELRLGILQMEHDSSSTKFISPLIRANFGFPYQFEFVSEFEYVPEDNELGDGAVGIKWVPLRGTLSLGIETLMLLPVRNGDDNKLGVESQLVSTFPLNNSSLVIHINGGLFHDPRGQDTENGWRASVLTELTNNSYRPGFELFTKHINGQNTDVRLGMGIIKTIGRFEVRSAVHFGLSSQAPDVIFNLWFSTNIPFR
jgi:hypothetical protein